VQSFVFLALLVLELFTMYATDRQTDGQKQRLMPLPYGRGHNNLIMTVIVETVGDVYF